MMKNIQPGWFWSSMLFFVLICELWWLIDAFIRKFLMEGHTGNFLISRFNAWARRKRYCCSDEYFPVLHNSEGSNSAYGPWEDLSCYTPTETYGQEWWERENRADKLWTLWNDRAILSSISCVGEKQRERVQTRNIYNRWIQERLG